MTSHLSEEQLEEYVRGRSRPRDIAAIEQHLLVCARCQQGVDNAENFAVGMKEALSEQPGNNPVAGASSWLDWFQRRPALTMGVGFACLILLIATFSSRWKQLAPSASLVLTAMRGEMTETAPARVFEITLADAPKDGGPYRVQVVNAVGSAEFTSLAAAGPKGVQFTEGRTLGPGDYFVRIYGPDEKVLHEYGFRVRQ